MDTSTHRRLDVGLLLAAVEAAPPIAAAEVLGQRLALIIGATDVSFLIADFSGDALVRLGHTRHNPFSPQLARETGVRVPLAGSSHGQAVAEQRVIIEQRDSLTYLFVPVTNRGEAIGVLELILPTPPTAETLDDIRLAAHIFSYVIITNRRFTDLFEWGQRSIPLSLAAEIQHRLLPGAFTCESDQFTLAAWLTPSANVGGDTFDFSMERDRLHLSLTDGMGHDVNAALLATILVGALRNARRAGVDLAEQARLANSGLSDFTMKHGGFVTGQVARIDLRSGLLTIVNAGHPLPMLLRNGQVSLLPLDPEVPFGAVATTQYHVQEFLLEPGDRVLFLTDGIIERNAENVDIEKLLLAGTDMHARQAVQHFINTVIRETVGDLKDDATVLCLDWNGTDTQELADGLTSS